MYMVTRECIFYINLRQAFLLSAQSANLVSSRTVLYTKVPEHYRDESRIRQLFGDSVKNVSVAGDSSEVENAVARRDRVAMMLEKAEVKLIKKVNKHRFSRYKTAPTGAVSSQTNYEFASDSQDAASGNNRPSHRLGFLGLFGTKVDTIEWSRSELERLIPEAERAQNVWKSGGYEKAPAIFVEFQSQCDAHAAYRAVTHHQALSLTPNSIGIRPDEVIWSNLAIPWWQLFIRQYAIFAFIGFLTIFWAIPVAAVGFVSQISLIQSLPGLTWIASIPSVSDDHLRPNSLVADNM
jgi:hypothetical protein